jgi:hypothetical protein
VAAVAWAPDYITLTEFRDFMEVPEDNTDDDVELALDITAASRAVDLETNRQFGSSTGSEARTYPAEWRSDKGRWVVVTDDLMVTPTAVTAGGTAVTGWRLAPVNALAKGRPYERLEFATDSGVVPAWPDYEVVVTANPWGWSAVPPTIKLATRMQASRFAARRGSPYGVAGSPDLGNEIRLLARLDADVAVMVAAYTRMRRAQ